MTDYGSPLQFGLSITPEAADIEAITDLAQLADATGLDLVAIQDHAYNQTFLDTWTLIAFLAAKTQRVHFLPDVADLPLRPPTMLAKAAATLDRLTSGRAELAVGAGAFWDAIAAWAGRGALRPRRSPRPGQARAVEHGRACSWLVTPTHRPAGVAVRAPEAAPNILLANHCWPTTWSRPCYQVPTCCWLATWTAPKRRPGAPLVVND